MPEESQVDVICLVLAIGEKCGKPAEYPDPDPVIRKMNKGLKLGDLSVYDKVIIEPQALHPWGLRRSPYNKYEYFVHEDLIEGYVKT